LSQRRTALITGASSGFGLWFARLFAADGFDVVLVARTVEPMEQVAEEVRRRHGVNATVMCADLAQDGAATALMRELGDIKVDALVNNAGFSTYGPFTDEDPVILDEMLHLNMVALTELTRACLAPMIERRWGRVLMLGSIGSFTAAPMTAAYAATKAYVLSLSLALGQELKGTGVSVTALCPGPTQTGFQQRADMADSKLIAGRTLPGAEAVARTGYLALKRGRPYVVTGASSRAFALATRVLPRTTASMIAGRSQERIA
jgi:short-subunit dehydrogenase